MFQFQDENFSTFDQRGVFQDSEAQEHVDEG